MSFSRFVMRVKGSPDKIEQFFKALRHSGGVRIGYGCRAVVMELDPDRSAATIYGGCALSASASLNDIKGLKEPLVEFITLYDACVRWGLDMELYSNNEQERFQDHLKCDKNGAHSEEFHTLKTEMPNARNVTSYGDWVKVKFEF